MTFPNRVYLIVTRENGAQRVEAQTFDLSGGAILFFDQDGRHVVYGVGTGEWTYLHQLDE